MVGSSGKNFDRSGEVTANARMSLDASGPLTDAGVVIMVSRRPPIMSVTALVMPLYGTWTISAPVWALSSSVLIWPMDPMPAEP